MKTIYTSLIFLISINLQSQVGYSDFRKYPEISKYIVTSSNNNYYENIINDENYVGRTKDFLDGLVTNETEKIFNEKGDLVLEKRIYYKDGKIKKSSVIEFDIEYNKEGDIVKQTTTENGNYSSSATLVNKKGNTYQYLILNSKGEKNLYLEYNDDGTIKWKKFYHPSKSEYCIDIFKYYQNGYLKQVIRQTESGDTLWKDDYYLKFNKDGFITKSIVTGTNRNKLTKKYRYIKN